MRRKLEGDANGELEGIRSAQERERRPEAKLLGAVRRASSVRDRRRANVLVIEDDAIVGQFLYRVLTGAGCDVGVARSCAEARQFQDCGLRFQVALVDIGLPDGSGLVVGEELVASGAVRHVIYYTGHERAGALDGARSAERLSGPIFSKEEALRAIGAAFPALAPGHEPRTNSLPAGAANENALLPLTSTTIVEFEDGLLRVDTNPEWVRVWVFGKERVLSRDLCAVLCLFAKNRGMLFPKDQVCQLALGNRVLSQSAVAKQIERLKAALPEAAHLFRQEHGRYGLF